MTRTTPARPVDVTHIAPAIAAFARTTLRLHPRRGNPTVHESSLGGPLLWPVDEPWPVCDRKHILPHSFRDRLSLSMRHTSLRTVASERRLRALLRAEEANGGARTPEQQSEISAILRGQGTEGLVDERPTPMLPILQLYLRDAHGQVVGPGGEDLLQVVWCPFDHEPESMPRTAIFWRKSSDVSDILVNPPSPILLQNGDYLPEPCILHPETVTEYPPDLLLPEAINDQLTAWMKSGENRILAGSEEERMAAYQYALSVAPGCKVGGWAPVSFRDVSHVTCESCGEEMAPFLYIDSCEWDAGSYSWRPVEEYDPEASPDGAAHDEANTKIDIGRGYGMQIYTCPTSWDHHHTEIMQ